MMNDIFMEYMLRKQKDQKDIMIITGLAVLAVILSLVLIILMFSVAAAMQTGQGIFSIGFLLLAGVWYGFYLLVGMRSVEFEYILTNSEMDIDKIMSKKARKRIASFDFKSAEIVACIDDNAHNADYRNKTVTDVLDVCGNKALSPVYFADVLMNDKPKRILFQPTSKMLETIRKYNPRNVFIFE
ncbi:MAG: hypothetical protein PUF72_02975 [Clostridiales bacterium]|nr:hypothetical protein [Clostridiales bacterium]